MRWKTEAPRLATLKELVLWPLSTTDRYYGIGARTVEVSLAVIQDLAVDWPEAPDFLLAGISTIQTPDVDWARPGLEPGRGVITDHPILAALWTQPLEEFDLAGRVAQTAMLISAAILLKADKPADFKSACRTACLSARRICAGKHVTKSLLDGLKKSGSLADVLNVLNALDADDPAGSILTPEQRRLIRGLKVFVRDALRRRGPRTRTVTTVQRRPRTSRPRESDDLVAPYSSYEDKSEGLPSQEDIDQGAAPVAESAGRTVQVIQISTAPHPATFFSPSQLHWRAKNRSRAIATSSQGLLLASDRLQLVDLAAMERAVRALRDRTWVVEAAIAQGAILSAASLVTGVQIEEIDSLHVVESLADVPEVPRFKYICVKERILVIPVPKPERGFVPDEQTARFYRPTVCRLELPMPEGLALTSLLLDFAAENRGHPFDQQHRIHAATEFARLASERFNARITVRRISDFSSRQLVATTGDWADAALLTGSGDANARIYYYAPTVQHLVDAYRQLWEGVYRGLGIQTTPLPTHAEKLPTDCGFPEPPPPYVSSQGCPTEQGVEKMVASLVYHCRSVLRGRRGRPRILRSHNALVSYICQMVLWHTGTRAVNDPVDLDSYDALTGTIGICDKTTDSNYSARVAWLPDIARKQIAVYSEHLAVLRNLVSKPLPERRLFLFDDNGEQQPVQLASLRGLLPTRHPYPLNAQRHYVRTRLREMGVPAQIIDAQLGHAALGQDPYARHSCFTVQRLKEEVGPPLALLSQRAGWAILPGLRT